MKRLLFLLFLLSTSYAPGAPNLYTNEYKFGSEGIIWDAQGWAEWMIEDNSTVKWDHQLPLPTGMGMSQITSASLTIEGFGIDNLFGDWDGDGPREGVDQVSVFLNDQMLGYLQGNSTTFELNQSLLTDPLLACANIEFRYDRRTSDTIWPVDTIRLASSTLQITVDDDIATTATIVPTPGAVLLCSIGTILVGYLKNRNKV